MSDKMEVYYFSPTGGTKKVSDIFAAAVGKDAVWHDLGDKQTPTKQPQGELVIVAAPVFAGRIPSVVREKIKTHAGEGKQAVTIAVYGNRAYEDALLEMNDILMQGGFTVIASAAFVAQHSIVPEVGAGRPDAEDIKEIRTFAEAVKNSTSAENVHVPGNRPYKPEMNVAAAPLSLPTCTACGACAKICPTDARWLRMQQNVFFAWPVFKRVRSRQEFFRYHCSKKQIICLLHSRLSEIKMKPFSKSFCLYAL